MHEYSRNSTTGSASLRGRQTTTRGVLPITQIAPSLPGIDRLSSALSDSDASILDPASEASVEFDRAARAIVLRVRDIDPVHVEHLIVALRKWWRESPHLRRTGDEAIRDALWNRLLTTCLETFYEDSARN